MQEFKVKPSDDDPKKIISSAQHQLRMCAEMFYELMTKVIPAGDKPDNTWTQLIASLRTVADKLENVKNDTIPVDPRLVKQSKQVAKVHADWAKRGVDPYKNFTPEHVRLRQEGQKK